MIESMLINVEDRSVTGVDVPHSPIDKWTFSSGAKINSKGLIETTSSGSFNPYVVIPSANAPNLFYDDCIVHIVVDSISDFSLSYPNDYRKFFTLYSTYNAVGGRLIFGTIRSGNNTITENYLGGSSMPGTPLPTVGPIGMIEFIFTRIDGINTLTINGAVVAQNNYTNSTRTNMDFVLNSYWETPNGKIRIDRFSRPHSAIYHKIRIDYL